MGVQSVRTRVNLKHLLCLLYLIHSFEVQASHGSQVLPSVRFNVICTANSIELQNLVFPANSSLKFLLSEQELLESGDNVLIEKILNTFDLKNSKTFAYYTYSDTYIKFSDLENGHTYYLYYVVIDEMRGIKIGPYLEIIKTNQNFALPSFFSRLNPIVFAPFLVPIFLLVLSVLCVRKFEKNCVKPEAKSQKTDSAKESRRIFYSLKPEFKLPIQGAFSQETISKLKENNEKELKGVTNSQERGEIDRIIKVLEEENKEFEDRLICEICCERFREVIFLGCGHVYCCEKCAMELVTCPIDKSVIFSKYRYTMCDKFGINHQVLPQIIASKLQSLDILKFNLPSNDIKKKEPTLMEKYMILKVKNTNYKMFYHCIICGERKRNILFVRCRHLICCHVCSENLKECPLDNISIVRKSHVFTA